MLCCNIICKAGGHRAALVRENVCVCLQSLSCIQLFAIPWTVARLVPLSRGFPRQEYWSGLPFPSPGPLPDPGIESESRALAVDSLLLSTGRGPQRLAH